MGKQIADRKRKEDKTLDPILKLMFDVLDERALPYPKVAKAVGVSYASFSNWRSGKTSPSLFTLRCIFDYLGLGLTASINKETVNNE